MMTPKKKYGGFLIAEGEQFDIIAAVNSSSNSPFWEFFSELSDIVNKQLQSGTKNTKEVKNYTTLRTYFEKFSEHGKWNNKTQLNSLTDGFFEFKNVDTGLRVPFYYDEHNRRVIILTHYFEKKQQKTPAKEIEKMKQLKSEFESHRSRHEKIQCI